MTREPQGRRESHHASYHEPPPCDCATVRAWDAAAIEEFAIPSILLMENAGESCARILVQHLLTETVLAPPFHIVCGPGNNGGDGFVIARHLANRGAAVQIYSLVPPSKIDPASDAGINLEIVRRMGLSLSEAPSLEVPDLSTAQGSVVDAIFGTGLARAVGPPFLEWIEAINDSGLPVVAVDTPSGLDADTGAVRGAAVRADRTLTFVARKKGFSLGAGPAHTGVVEVVGISIPRTILERASESGA